MPNSGRPARTAATPRLTRRDDQIFGGYRELVSEKGSYSKAFDEMFDADGNVEKPLPRPENAHRGTHRG
ncbi:hypothetical protein ABFW00_18830, partial [Mycobacteroides abscessus]|uniref:hypothetical protein n=1 Tax=Mycobacteroides abscessus TaxID=36809 RepID=UPI0034CED8CE